jgi:predicted nucleic acid-binding protein
VGTGGPQTRMEKPDVSDLIIVDTDVLIDAGRNRPEALACLRQVEHYGSPAISTVTCLELLSGCQNKTDLQALDHLLERFQIVRLNEEISDASVALLRRYRLSHGLLLADALIAATALSLARPLVSKNQRDYRFIDGLNLLSYPQPFAA